MSEKQKEFQKKETEQLTALLEKSDAENFRKACAKKGESKNAVIKKFIKRFNKKQLKNEKNI